MWRTKVVAVMGLAIAAGCGGKKSAGSEVKWLAAKTVMQNGNVKGQTFTIEVPEGLPRKDDELRVEWRNERSGPEGGPAVHVGIEHFPPKTIEEAVKDTMPDEKETITKQEATDGGFLVMSHSARKGYLEAHFYKAMPGAEHGLSCWATFVGKDDEPVGKLQETLDWLEKTCRTLKLTGNPWVTKTLTEQQDKIDKAKYSVKLWDGFVLAQGEGDKPDVWRAADGKGPTVTIDLELSPMNADALLERDAYKAKAARVTRKKFMNGLAQLSFADGTKQIEAQTLVRTPTAAVSLRCMAEYVAQPDEQVGADSELMKTLEAVCDSLTSQGLE